MSGFDNYFHGRFASARAYVLQRLLLSMLALDVWMLMIGHAGRYGTAGFNVAHFRWLDAIIPIPSPELYIGVGLRGDFNHLVGIQRAGVVVGINNNRRAPLFRAADMTVFADWHEFVPELTEALRPLLG